jgi:hypothetical protein
MEPDLEPVQIDRCFECRQHAIGKRAHAGGLIQSRRQNGELRSFQPGQRVGGAQAAGQTPRRFLNGAITHRPAHAVGHQPEIDQIDQHQPAKGLGCLVVLQRHGEALVKQCAVGQQRQGVVKRLSPDKRFEMGTFRDVSSDGDENRRRFVAEKLKADFHLVSRAVTAVMESLVADLIHGAILQRPHQLREILLSIIGLQVHWRHAEHFIRRIAQVLASTPVYQHEMAGFRIEDVNLVDRLLDDPAQPRRLLLGQRAFGDVTKHYDIGDFPAQRNAGDRRLGRELGAVAAQSDDLPTLAHQPRSLGMIAEIGHLLTVAMAEALRQQRLYRLPDYVGRFVLEDPFGGTVEQDDTEAAIHDDEGVTSKVEDLEQRIGDIEATVSQYGAQSCRCFRAIHRR